MEDYLGPIEGRRQSGTASRHQIIGARWSMSINDLHVTQTIIKANECVTSPVVYSEQAAILKRVLARERSQKDLATRLDLSRQWLERAMSGDVALGTETCLQIALEYDENPLGLLRAAGKDRLADLLQRAGFSAGDVSASDRDLLSALRSLPDAQQRPLRDLIRSLSAQAAPSARRKPRRRS